MCYITNKLQKKRVTLQINNIKICNITKELHKNVLNYKKTVQKCVTLQINYRKTCYITNKLRKNVFTFQINCIKMC